MRILIPERFAVIRTLREDSHSKTFQANDYQLDRENLVVKIIKKGYFPADREELIEHFSWLIGVQHSLFAVVLESGFTSQQHLYYVRECLPPSVLFSTDPFAMMKSLVCAVNFLSKHGRIHGAIKPSNIFATKDITKLTDAKISAARPFEKEESIHFTAPEVLQGKDITHEADLYSLGAVLYRLLTGRHLFEDPDPCRLTSKYLSASPQPAPYLSTVTPSIFEPLVELLSRNPTKRRGAFECLKRALRSCAPSAERGLFVGRKDLLQQAVETVAQATSNLRVLLIEGQTGIGKSRLLMEMRLRCGFRGFSFVTCHCRHGSINLSPVLEGLNKLLKTDSESSRARLKLDLEGLASARSRFSGKDFPIQRTISDLIGLITSLCRRFPLILAIDDIHLADSGTVVFLEQLAFRASEIPLKLVLTVQTSEVQPRWLETVAACLGRDFHRLRIPKLSDEESINLVRFLAEDEDRYLKVAHFSAGNPLFIESYSKCKTLDCAAGPTEAVASMISTLTVSMKGVLEVLSVFSKPVSLTTVARVYGKDLSVFQSILNLASDLGQIRLIGELVEISYPIVALKLYASISKTAKVRLNRAAFLALKELESDIEVLARYAFEGGLFREASSLHREIGKRLFQRQNYGSALYHYAQAQRCYSRGSQVLTPTEMLQLARCYEWAGKEQTARRLYKGVLSSEAVQEDREVLAAVYRGLSLALHRTAFKQRIHFLELAIGCLPGDSLQLIRLYSNLCATFIRIGDVARAKETLEQVQVHVVRHNKSLVSLYGLRASLQEAVGDFRGARHYYSLCIADDAREILEFCGVEKLAVLNNLGNCCESLGDLVAALEHQSTTQKLALINGNIPVQILSIANRAAIKMKLGALREAEDLFNQAQDQINRLPNAGIDKNRFFFSVKADSILHAVYVANYAVANDGLKRVRIYPGSAFELDRMSYEIIRCKFFLEVGLTRKVRDLLRRLRGSAIFNVAFFQVECVLIEARILEITPQERSQRLQNALQISQNLETVYQQCEVLTSLAAVNLELGEREKAEGHAKAALELVQKNGYKLLEAQGLLLSGLASDKPHDKQTFLSDAFRLASEIGLQELIGESAYHIGVLNLESGNTITAREYLIRSTSITARLAEGVPNAARAKYLSKKWRREAIQALDRCNQSIPLLPSAFFNSDGDKYFAEAYRFTMAASAVTSIDGLLSSIEKTMTGSFSRSAVITLKNGANSHSIPLRIKLSPELTQRMDLLRTTAKNRVFFDSAAEKGKQTSAWIPLNSETCDGGIYVASRSHESPFTEKEIELLTMIGSIASSALRRLETRQANEAEPQELSEFHGMIGASKPMREIYSQIRMAAANAATVLIEGESGTGKELVAKAIHADGPRAKQPFSAVDCGAIPEGLIEAELFGSKKGSYTGAVADRPGLFEAANRGTIFLDEISNTTTALQAKLLRVIQEREVRRIGETKGRAIDVRLIVASNQSLEALAEAGQFRKDLLYRLKVLHIKVPALRNRRDDIPMLAYAFLQKLNANNKTRKYFASGVIDHLTTQKFSGNVRELQNALERAFFLSKGTMITDVPLETSTPGGTAPVDEIQVWFKDLSEGRKDFWSAIHNRYKRRDISREKVLALVDFGLRSTRGSYKNMASMFRLKERDYRRFMDFLRRNECLLDFRPYRKAATAS